MGSVIDVFVLRHSWCLKPILVSSEETVNYRKLLMSIHAKAVAGAHCSRSPGASPASRLHDRDPVCFGVDRRIERRELGSRTAGLFDLKLLR